MKACVAIMQVIKNQSKPSYLFYERLEKSLIKAALDTL